LVTIKDFLANDVVVLHENDSILESLGKSGDKGKTLVADCSGKITGLTSVGKLLECCRDHPGRKVSEIMDREFIVFEENNKNDDFLEEILGKDQEYVPVINRQGGLVGVLDKVNIIKYLIEKNKSAVEKLEAVLNSTHDGIVAIDSFGRVATINAAAERILGLPAEEVMGSVLNNHIPGSGLQALVQDGQPQLGVLVEVRGKTLLSNRTPIYSDGRVVGAVAVFEDITGITKLSQTLEDTRTAVDVLETILNTTYDGIVLVDRSGIITKLNKAYQEFLGIKEEEAVGRHVTEVIENSRMHIVVETGKAEIGHIQKIQGKEMVVMRIPIFKDGDVVGAVGKVMFRDVRELRALAENLNLIESELKYYKSELLRIKGAKYSFNNIFGNSPKILKAKQLAKQAAISNSTVLIYGESGTGKEIFAHAIHNYSHRRFGPFIRVNCGAIPSTLFEAELFGYEEGAFTGAARGGKPGKFELANKGTIFLDEAGEIPLEMQVKLLRVLQERETERVGGTHLIPLDVRVVSASNRPLEELVKEKKFREDLFYRLNVFRIELPSLREMAEDIPLIARHLITELNEALSSSVEGLEDEVAGIFKNHSWPGNIRELRNVLERAINVNRQGKIGKSHLPLYLVRKKYSLLDEFFYLEEEMPLNLEALLDKVEKTAIERALALTNHNKRQAAILLGIHRSAVYQKIKKYGLEDMQHK
jgi:PAS domain S-box-containing protein